GLGRLINGRKHGRECLHGLFQVSRRWLKLCFYFDSIEVVSLSQPLGICALIAMGYIDIFSPGGQYRVIELLPVAMIREDKAPINTCPTPSAAKLHPATAHCFAGGGKAIYPRSIQCRGGCYYQSLLNGLFFPIHCNPSSGKGMSFRVENIVHIGYRSMKKYITNTLV